MKFQFVYLFLFFVNTAFTQVSNKLTITSQKLPFVVLVNDVLQAEQPSTALHLKDLQDGSFDVKIVLLDSLKIEEKSIFVSNNEHLHIEIGAKKGVTFLRIVGQYLDSLQPDQLTSLQLNDNNTQKKLLQLTKNEAFVAKLSPFANYTGKSGCNNPIKIDKQKLITQVEDALLTRQKTNLILSELSDKCISIADLKSVLEFIDYEDVRLAIIHELKLNLFDIDNLNQLDGLFTIKQNQEEFNRFKNDYK
jgi:hypothetical protein